MNRIFSFLIFILLFLNISAKVGYIDSEKIFSRYKGMDDINKRIESEMIEWKKQLTDMQREINNLENDYKNQEPMLSEDAKVRKRDEINKKREALNKFIESIWGESGKATLISREYLKPVADKIDEVLKKIGEDENYEIIFDISEGNIVFVKSENDLTNRVIDELNKEFFIPVASIKKYIVYDFSAKDKETRNEQYHIKIASLLYRNLKIDNVIEPVPIRDVNNLLKTRDIVNIEDLSIQDALSMGSELDADFIIIGSVEMSGSRIIINLSVHEAKQRVLMKEISKEAVGDIQFNEIVSEIIVEIKKELNI